MPIDVVQLNIYLSVFIFQFNSQSDTNLNVDSQVGTLTNNYAINHRNKLQNQHENVISKNR